MILSQPPLLLGVISTLAALTFNIFVNEDVFDVGQKLNKVNERNYRILYHFTNMLRTLTVLTIVYTFILTTISLAVILFAVSLAYLLTFLLLKETDLLGE